MSAVVQETIVLINSSLLLFSDYWWSPSVVPFWLGLRLFDSLVCELCRAAVFVPYAVPGVRYAACCALPAGVLNSPKSLAFLCSAIPLACGCVGLDGAALSMRLRVGRRLWLRWWLSVWRPFTPWSLVADGWAVGLRRLRELGLVGLRLRPAFGLGRSAS